MSYMYQREGFKGVEYLLGQVTALIDLVRIKEAFLKQEADGTYMWHIHVDNDAFEAITDKSMQMVHQSDNEADGLVVERVSIQTSNYIKLFTIYELGVEFNVSD